MAECTTGVLIELCDDEPEPSERLYFDDDLRQKIVNGNWWDEEKKPRDHDTSNGNKEAILVDISDDNDRLLTASICEDFGSDPYHADLSLLDTESLLEDEVFDFDCAKSMSSDEADEDVITRTGTKDKKKVESTNKKVDVNPTQLGPREMAEVFKEATMLAMKFTTIGQKRRSLQLQSLQVPSVNPNLSHDGDGDHVSKAEKMEVDQLFSSMVEKVASEESKENCPVEAVKCVESTAAKNTKKDATPVLRKETFRVEKSKMRLSALVAVGPKPKMPHGTSQLKAGSTKSLPGMTALRSERKSVQSVKVDVAQTSYLKRSNSQSNPKTSAGTFKGPPAPSRIPTSPLTSQRRQRSSSGSSVSSFNSSCSTDISSRDSAIANSNNSVSAKKFLNSIVPKTLQQSLAINKKKAGITNKSVPMKATVAMKLPASPATPAADFKKVVSSGVGNTPMRTVTPSSNPKRFSFGSGSTPSSKTKTVVKSK